MPFFVLAMGPVPSPFDCYLVNRSLKTLHIRMREHMKNGLAVARFLENHPCVEKVIHPGNNLADVWYLIPFYTKTIFIVGLPSHPQHELAKRQQYGHSGMCSIYIKGGLTESRAFFKALKVFTLGESLGGYESLAGKFILFFRLTLIRI